MPANLALLTGPDAGEVLRAALAPAGGQLLDWRASQVDYQPRRGSTALYRARVRWAGGQVTRERFGVYTGPPPPAGAVVVGNGDEQVAVWRFPHDPYLPGLAVAYDPAAAAGLLRTYGLGDGDVRPVLRAYRPRRRAVIEVVGTAGRLFLKVVRPRQVRALHERHRLCAGAGVPVPPSLGYTTDGLLVLQPLAGQAMREALQHPGAQLPSGAAIPAMLDRLPRALVEGPGRPSWRDRAEHYAAVVAGILPDQAPRARQLGAVIAAEAGAGPTVPAHGDFYENQLWVAGGRITGLLDIDTAGPGERLDDLACLLGHLAVLAQIRPDRAPAIQRLGRRYRAEFESAADPVQLRYRVAAVVLSLATGPHRVQEPGWSVATRRRLDLVERWVDGARVRRMSPLSSPAQDQLIRPANAGHRAGRTGAAH